MSLRSRVAPVRRLAVAIGKRVVISSFTENLVMAAMRSVFVPLSVVRRGAADVAAPLVTIVVPVFNVRGYLAVCLDSLLAQSHRNIRVIIVDDGSTDGSRDVARSYVRRFPALHLIEQANAGLAAARNTGVDAIEHTDFVMFVDSDDVLPPGAVARYVRAMGTNDLVVGSAWRMRGMFFQQRQPNLYRHDIASTTLSDSVHYISDVTAWNKLIRWSLWSGAGLRFPDGYLYEDMAVMTDAYARASTFGVVRTASYWWRVRTGSTPSITQRRWEPINLEHRLFAIAETQRVLSAHFGDQPNHPVWEHYRWSVIRFDFQFYVEMLPRTDSAYFDTFARAASALFADAPESFWQTCPPKYVGAIRAVVAGDRERALTELASVGIR